MTPRTTWEPADAALTGERRRAALVERLEPVVPGDAAERVADVLLRHFHRAPWGPMSRVASEIAAFPDLDQALAPPPDHVHGATDTAEDGDGWARRWSAWSR